MRRREMNDRRSEAGFTLVELAIASLLTMVIMGVAFETFRNGLVLNETVQQTTDASQNLRAGTNLLIRDLMQAGRNIQPGGIAIPSGPGAQAIRRPSRPGTTLYFDTTAVTTLNAITTGMGQGLRVAGRDTDLITILMDDPFLSELELYTSGSPSTLPVLAADGRSFTVGDESAWLEGDPESGLDPIKPGDLIYFYNAEGTTIQTVTSVSGGIVRFDDDAADKFNFNQPWTLGAEADAEPAPAGTIADILPEVPDEACVIDDDPADNDVPANECNPSMTVRRVYLYTYYVALDGDIPRLMRAINLEEPQALAGVIEDLELTYDLVDGVYNPTDVPELPYEPQAGQAYSANQIRKVNVHVGVRSETKSSRTKDYMRNHLSTVVSLRNLAYVDRYK